jgi:hypothetical protein
MRMSNDSILVSPLAFTMLAIVSMSVPHFTLPWITR